MDYFTKSMNPGVMTHYVPIVIKIPDMVSLLRPRYVCKDYTLRIDIIWKKIIYHTERKGRHLACLNLGHIWGL